MFYKRKGVISLVLCLLFVVSNFGCGGENNEKDKIDRDSLFSVHFLNVGQGDCTFIRLPDGKNILIDTGEADGLEHNKQYITNYLNSYNVTTIDYLVLTHPDSDHVGNAEHIINEFVVLNAYIPYVANIIRPNYHYFDRAYTALQKEGARLIISDFYQYVKGENYAIAFLSPKQKDMSGGSYLDFNSSLIPSEQESNDLSPIIYFQAYEKRMLFTGDAGKSQEKIVVDNYSIGLYDAFFNRYGIQVVLEDVDCLKVGHHGSDTSSSKRFIDLLKPKNAVISVGGNNYYGHPSTATLERLEQANPNYKLYRTDYHNTIVFSKYKDGSFYATFN